MRRLLLAANVPLTSFLLVASICAGTCAHASGPFTVTGTTVLTETGKDLRLLKGDNYVDQPAQMNCVSAAGCSVVIQSKLGLEGNKKNEGYTNWCVRSLVDGVEAEPNCTYETAEGLAYTQVMQTLDIAQGTHTVQTDIVCTRTFTDRKWRGTLKTWVILYTMYGH